MSHFGGGIAPINSEHAEFMEFMPATLRLPALSSLFTKRNRIHQ
jgi:hypothetical protein